MGAAYLELAGRIDVVLRAFIRHLARHDGVNDNFLDELPEFLLAGQGWPADRVMLG